MGGHPNTTAHPPTVPGPPASILYVSNSVAPDVDELTHNILEWGGVSVSVFWFSSEAVDTVVSVVSSLLWWKPDGLDVEDSYRNKCE